LLDLPAFGLFVAPFGIAAFVLVARRSRRWPEDVGVICGMALTVLFVALLNLGYQPCGEGPIVLSPGQAEYSCGGLDPLPWAAVGVTLLVAGLAVYATALLRLTPPAARIRTERYPPGRDR
jgi:hypothetical protein